MNSSNLEPLTPADVAWLESMERMIRAGKRDRSAFRDAVRQTAQAVAEKVGSELDLPPHLVADFDDREVVTCGCADPVCPKVHPVDVER